MDPNNNNNPAGRGAAKDVQSQQGGRRQRNGNGPRLNERGEMDILGGGNIGDDLMIAAMFMMGVAFYLLREVCVC
jgi:hypothetical protein